MKKKQILLILFLSSVKIWASIEPEDIIDSGPEPPQSSIDNYLIVSMLICFLFVRYYFYKYNKTYLNNEK